MKIASLIKTLITFLLLSSSSFACIEDIYEDFEQAENTQEVQDLIEMARMDLMFCQDQEQIKKLALKSVEMTGDAYYYMALKMDFLELYRDSFQVGSEWNRELVDESSLEEKQVENYKRFVSINNASGYYFGDNLVITNEHVVRNKECSSLKMTINTNETSLKCTKIVKVVKNLDLAIIEVEDNEVLNQYQKATIEKPRKGQQLITFGRGYLNNDGQKIKVEASEDCRVILNHDEMGMMLNKESVAIGCDVSNGDSGSLVFDKESGNIVGLVWGNINNHFPLSSEEIREMNKDEKYIEVLKLETSYMAPANLILDVLESL